MTIDDLLAFMEGYHLLRTHPQLYKAAGALYNSFYGQETGGIGAPVNMRASTRENIASQIKHLELLSEGMAGMCHAKDVEAARGLVDVEVPDEDLVRHAEPSGHRTGPRPRRTDAGPQRARSQRPDQGGGIDLPPPLPAAFPLQHGIRPLGPEAACTSCGR